MKIQYCSDLHADMGHQPNYLENNTIVPSADTLILAGDIHRASLEANNQIFNWLSQNFKTVYWLPGNHEFYNGVNVNKFKEICHPVRENVFLINNKSITFPEEDLTIFFSMLWSKLDPINAHMVEHGMNDFYLIKVDGKILNIALYDYLYQTHWDWLQNAIKNDKSGKKVVVTHHCPSKLCNHPDFEHSPLNSGFMTDLTDYIEKSNIDYWIYGHTHRNMPEITIGKTKLITNQFCYHFAGEGKDYQKDKIFEI